MVIIGKTIWLVHTHTGLATEYCSKLHRHEHLWSTLTGERRGKGEGRGREDGKEGEGKEMGREGKGAGGRGREGKEGEGKTLWLYFSISFISIASAFWSAATIPALWWAATISQAVVSSTAVCPFSVNAPVVFFTPVPIAFFIHFRIARSWSPEGAVTLVQALGSRGGPEKGRSVFVRVVEENDVCMWRYISSRM